MKKLYTIAKSLREAIENYGGIEEHDKWDEDINQRLEKFPIEACEEASAYLANILKHKYDYKNVKIVHGNLKEGWGYHTWVKEGDVDLDITPDQFEECDEKIIIETDSVFHDKKFNIVNDWDGLIDVDHWAGSREKYYNEILKIMNLD